jgi:hypothetical protein
MDRSFRVEAGSALGNGERPGNPRRSPGVLDDFDVIWSASKQRAGECGPLSSYNGNSSIANARKLALMAPGTVDREANRLTRLIDLKPFRLLRPVPSVSSPASCWESRISGSL